MKLPSQGEGDHPWFLWRRNGLARGIDNRLAADCRLASWSISNAVQLCLDATFGHGGFSAYRNVSGSNPADLYMWRICRVYPPRRLRPRLLPLAPFTVQNFAQVLLPAPIRWRMFRGPIREVNLLPRIAANPGWPSCMIPRLPRRRIIAI